MRCGDATQHEVKQLRRENAELKQLVGDLSLEVYRFKKNGHPDSLRRRRYQRVSAVEKAAILAEVASSPVPKRKILRELGIPKTTYYRWLRRRDQQRLEDDAGGGKPVWNRLTFQEVRYVLSAARAELPSAGRMDHRQPGLLSLRVDCLPYLAQGGSGEEA